MLRVNISPKSPKKSLGHLTRPELILVNRIPDIRLVSSTITTYPTYTFRNLDCFIFKSSNVISFFFRKPQLEDLHGYIKLKAKLLKKSKRNILNTKMKKK